MFAFLLERSAFVYFIQMAAERDQKSKCIISGDRWPTDQTNMAEGDWIEFFMMDVEPLLDSTFGTRS